MSFEIAPSIRDANLQNLTTALAGGRLKFFSGSQPAFGGSAGVLQASVSLSNPAATVNSQVLTFEPIGDALRVAADAITWARFETAAGAPAADANVTEGVSSAGAIRLTNINGTVGGFVTILSGQIAG